VHSTRRRRRPGEGTPTSPSRLVHIHDAPLALAADRPLQSRCPGSASWWPAASAPSAAKPRGGHRRSTASRVRPRSAGHPRWSMGSTGAGGQGRPVATAPCRTAPHGVRLRGHCGRR
jgi:hypothetical protein